MPLSATTTRVGEGVAPRNEVELRAAVDRERGEIAGVDADHRRAERDRALELGGVVRLDERVQTELGGERASASARWPSSRSRRSSSTASAPASFAVRRCSSVEKKPFASSGSADTGPGGAQVVPVAAEALVDEDGDGGGAGASRSPRRARPGSASGRMSPSEGERRLNSAIAPRPGPAKASLNRIREPRQLFETRGRGAGVDRLAGELEPLPQVFRPAGCGDRAGRIQEDRVAPAAVRSGQARRGSPARSRPASRRGARPGRNAGSRGRADRSRARAPRRRRPRRRRSGRRARARRSRARRARRTRGARRAARAPPQSCARATACRPRSPAPARRRGS